jgi:uncharacterized protein
MEFYRKIQLKLQEWRHYNSRKPLILRGARQVGKTTAIHEFGTSFSQYIYLNLEKPKDSVLFDDYTDIHDLTQKIFLAHNKSVQKLEDTLLFIDEIQERPKVMNLLRYFYEDIPSLSVIAAGSMLESLFDHQYQFPVGRVEYFVLRPANFEEFLHANNETAALEVITTVPLPEYATDRLFDLFHTFALIGGMPEIVKQYARTKDLKSLNRYFQSIINSYIDDVEKYAISSVQVQYLRFVIKSMFSAAGSRIKFENFANSNYKSKDMGESLRTLEKAMILNLSYPTTNHLLPLIPDYKKSPKLQILDTGLLNHFVGLQMEILKTKALNEVYRGTMIELLVGQEIKSTHYDSLEPLHFWVRDKKASDAEVDYILNFHGKLIPVEVKSGKIGKLKSLLIYMDLAPHTMAVRVYGGKLSIDNVTTPNGKEFKLLNLPYFLSFKIYEYLDWFESELGL